MNIIYITEPSNKQILQRIYIEDFAEKDATKEILEIKIPKTIKGVYIQDIGYNNEYSLVEFEPSSYFRILETIKEIQIKFEGNPITIRNCRLDLKKMIPVSIKIPESVTKICFNAFCGIYFKNFELPKDSIETLFSYSFSNCIFDCPFTVPASCKIIESYTFQDTIFKSGIYFEENSNLTTIAHNAFINSELNLDKLLFPENLKEIGNNAFANVKKVKEVIFENHSQINKILAEAFMDSEVEKIIIKDNSSMGLVLKEKCFANCLKLQLLDLENTKTTIIPEECCKRCENLIEVKLPSAVLGIKGLAFTRCNIEKMKLPKDLKYIGAEAFSFNKMKEIIVENTTLDSLNIENHAFANNKLKTLPENIFSLISYCGNGVFAFNDFSTLSLTPPKNSTSLGKSIFTKNKQLTKVILKNTDKLIWKHIPSFLFDDCNQLTDITLPDSITTLEQGCFIRTKIKNIELKNIKTIEEYAFAYCSALEFCDFSQAPLQTIENKAFLDTKSLKKILLPSYITIDKSCLDGIPKKILGDILENCPFIT